MSMSKKGRLREELAFLLRVFEQMLNERLTAAFHTVVQCGALGIDYARNP